MHDVTVMEVMRSRRDGAERHAEATARHAAEARAGCVRAQGLRGVLGGCSRPRCCAV